MCAEAYPESRSGFVYLTPGTSADELLPSVDVVGRARDGGVGHDVDGQGSDVGGPDDAADRERAAQLLAPGVEPIAEERGREGRVDEAGRDEVDADRRELECE